MKRIILAAVSLSMLSGCGLVARDHARSDMMQSKKAYTDCLVANSANPAVCQGLRQAYEVNAGAFRGFQAVHLDMTARSAVGE